MTTDDFKQKCDEIHRIVCYLLDREFNKPYIGTLFVHIHGFDFNKGDIFEMETFICAIEVADSIKAYYNV